MSQDHTESTQRAPMLALVPQGRDQDGLPIGICWDNPRSYRLVLRSAPVGGTLIVPKDEDSHDSTLTGKDELEVFEVERYGEDKSKFSPIGRAWNHPKYLKLQLSAVPFNQEILILKGQDDESEGQGA